MRILITEPAGQQLKEIYQYYRKNVGQELAGKLRMRIMAAIGQLKMNPEIGQIEENLQALNLGHRRIVEGHYKIIYRIEKDMLFITDIFDSRRKPSEMKG